MLTFLNLKNDLYRFLGATSTTARADMVEAVRLAILKGQQYFSLWGDWSFLEKYGDTVYLPLIAPYITGTVAVTQDSKTITGTGTTWNADMVGQFFQLSNQELYEIQSFTSTTSMILSIPYQSSSSSAQQYQVIKRFYPLPLDFMRADAREASITSVGSTSETEIRYSRDADFFLRLETGRPLLWAVLGNTPRADYYSTGTVTIVTSAGVSTWTISTGTLPTDSVDREVRILGEDRPYRINARLSGTTFSTYQTYVNPADQTNTQAVASTWAMTPKETLLVGFDKAADQRYVFKMPYIKRLSELLLDTDISPISLAGYDDALLATCRAQLAIDGRTAQRGDQVGNVMKAREDALINAWGNEQLAITKEEQDEGFIFPPRQAAPSWIGE